MTKNRLSSSTSPYLLQHEDNPVHWWPWCDDALQEAKTRDLPILLSIGYSACHWCHVMAHESFEDEDTAELMNKAFINIKVDREERPDLDHIYQTAIQILGQQGGWPLTVFLTPDQKPFWGGTYFPKDAKYGQPAFKDVLHRISTVYQEKDPAVLQNAENVSARIAEFTNHITTGELAPDTPLSASSKLLNHIDPHYGGFGQQQKFPSPMNLESLWRTFSKTGEEPYKNAVLNTLNHICEGGIYDHLGGGFSRYTVDRQWLIPHFEKMLYDNALLIRLLTQVWRKERSPLYAQRVEETITWLLREMRSENQLFTSSYDADSEGEEGKFYTWSAEEIREVLGPDSKQFMSIYDITDEGNWEGQNILNRLNHIGLESTLSTQRHKLYNHRRGRIHPGHDQKCLCDWNGLTVIGLTEAAMTFDKKDWLNEAIDSFNAMGREFEAGGELFHVVNGIQKDVCAFLEDYSSYGLAALHLYSATGQLAYLEKAVDIENIIDEKFKAPDGGYFMSSNDTAQLISRPRPISDQATPSGNGLMADLLVRLYALTDDENYKIKADQLFDTFAGEVHRNIFPLGSFLNAFDTHISGYRIYIHSQREDFQRTVWENAPPQAIIKPMDRQEAQNMKQENPAYANLQNSGDYVLICQGQSCSLPLTTVDEIQTALTS